MYLVLYSYNVKNKVTRGYADLNIRSYVSYERTQDVVSMSDVSFMCTGTCTYVLVSYRFMGVSHTPLTPSTKKCSLGKYELRTSVLRLTTKETKRGEWYVVMSQLTWGDIPPEAYLFRHTSGCKWYSNVPRTAGVGGAGNKFSLALSAILSGHTGSWRLHPLEPLQSLFRL